MLVGNTIKFTDAGEVEVSVEVSGDLAPDDVGLRFAVRDTGIGIPKEKQEAIFRAFEQEDTSTTRRYAWIGRSADSKCSAPTCCTGVTRV